MKPCRYCGQTATRKDMYGYCKKHNCFEVSRDKQKLSKFIEEIKSCVKIPKFKRNFMDRSYYNPRQERLNSISKEIIEYFGCIPLEVIDEMFYVKIHE